MSYQTYRIYNSVWWKLSCKYSIFIVELVDKSKKISLKGFGNVYGIFGLIRYFGLTKITGISRSYPNKALSNLKRFKILSILMENSMVQTYFTIIFTKMHLLETSWRGIRLKIAICFSRLKKPKTRQKLIKFCQRSLLSQELAEPLHLPLHMQSSL